MSLSLEVRLLLGWITDEEYRGALVAESRGLRFPIARPGWPRRFYRVIEGIVALLIFALLLTACSADILLIGAGMDALPL